MESIGTETSRSLQLKSDTLNQQNSLPITKSRASLDLLKGAVPNLFYFTIGNLGYAMNFYFISASKDEVLIASVGLGNTCIECTTLAVIYSLNSGLCTLMAQSHGANSHKLTGHYLHRGLMLNFCSYILCSCLWLFSKQLLIRLNYQEQVAENTSIYLAFMIPAMLFSLIFDTLKNFVQAHKIFTIPTYIQSFCTLIEVGTSYLAVIVFNQGIKGLAFSRIFSEFNKTWIMLLYTKRSEKFRPSFFFFEKESFSKIITQLNFEVIAGSILFLEWLAYLLSTLLAAHLEIKEFDGYLMANQIINFLCMIPYALGVPLASLVSNSMGEMNVQKTKVYIRMGLFLGTIASLVISTFTIFSSPTLAHIFSKDEEIDDIMLNLLRIYCLLLLIDTYQSMLGGIGRSIGKEKISSIMFLISYYFCGISSSYLLAYPFNLRAYGIRWGIGLAQFINTIIFAVMIFKVDFDEQAKVIHLRLQKDSHQTEKTEEVSGIQSDNNLGKYALLKMP